MSDGVWRTISGRKVFIGKGQSLTDAMKDSGKFKGKDLQGKLKEQLGKDKPKDKPKVEDNIPQDLKDKFLKHKNYDDFVNEHGSEALESGLFGKDTDKAIEKIENKWKDLHYEDSAKDLKSISEQNAVDIARDGISDADRKGWFVNADSDYKPKIEQKIITDSELRNASLNMAHRVYQETTGKDVPFDKFVNSEIEVYRGGNFEYIDNDVFVAYSFSKDIAKSFGKKGQKIETLRVKVKDTLGSLQTDGEAELMVRRRNKKMSGVVVSMDVTE